MDSSKETMKEPEQVVKTKYRSRRNLGPQMLELLAAGSGK